MVLCLGKLKALLHFKCSINNKKLVHLMHRGIAVLLLVKLRTTKSSFWKLFVHFDTFCFLKLLLGCPTLCRLFSANFSVLSFEFWTSGHQERLSKLMWNPLRFEEGTILLFSNSVTRELFALRYIRLIVSDDNGIWNVLFQAIFCNIRLNNQGKKHIKTKYPFPQVKSSHVHSSLNILDNPSKMSG